MATTAERKRSELNEAYVDAHAFVMHYLDEIQARIHDMPAPESDGLRWGHVGDMNKIKNDLREIVDFLNGYQQ
jgi:hypothetical protein